MGVDGDTASGCQLQKVQGEQEATVTIRWIDRSGSAES